MKNQAKDFTVEVEGIAAICPIGEKVGKQNLTDKKIPVFSCEGACIRGEIARLAANLIGKKEPFRRACHGEMFTVPHSAMAQWTTEADRVIVIDGCFLRCHGRILKNLIGEEKMVQIDAYSLYRKYSDRFDIDSVPEGERKEVAQQVVDKTLQELTEQ
ncbi:putative zinc-binding protein [Gemmatimonadota bacterium]